jgi:Mesyanzhinovviridae DNA helicase
LKYRPKTRPFPHQSKATLRAVREGNLAFFMEPRTGKTKAVLDAIAIQHLKGRVDRVMVVCPLSAIDVWVDEIREHYPLPYRISTPDGTIHKTAVNVRSRGRVHFFLLNYDKARQRSKEGKRWVYEWAKGIEDWAPDLVCLDESHRAKRAGAVTAQLLWRSVARMRKARRDGRPFVYLMTGTPNPKGYLDIFAQYRIMDPEIFGTNVGDFKDNHCEYGHGYNKYRVVRYRNKSTLLRKIRDHSFIISRAEAFPDGEPELPPVNIKIHLPPKVRRKYNELVEEGLLFLEQTPKGTAEVIEGLTPAVLRMRCQQVTGGFTTSGRLIHSTKLKMARDILSDLYELEEPVVVYCRFLPEVHAVRKTAAALGYRAFEVYGKTKTAERTKARKALSRTDKPTCVVFQVATGSLAIDLSAAHEALFYSLPDSFIDYYQAVSRFAGPKQKQAVRVRHLVCPGTVDIRQLAGLREKADLHAELMGNPKRFLFGL